MRVDLFDYELPPELIAQEPMASRDQSRLLVLDRAMGRILHRRFVDLPEFLHPGDCLVLNNTRVLAARLAGTRARTGGQWEGLFLRERDGLWEVMGRTRGKPTAGERIRLDRGDFDLELVEKTSEGTWLARPGTDAPIHEMLEAAGHVPLPPYIRKSIDRPEDRQRYQTVYATEWGAVAAPTAGLHFTPELFDRLADSGVLREQLTLHVGPGTFKPVSAEDTSGHHMHSEWCQLSAATADHLRVVQASGKRIVAVGTTSVRVLETACQQTGRIEPSTGPTDLFIVPGYQFRAVDGLVTNFHLPRSTLLMLVCAFAGVEQTLAAYREAVRERYRFYSYGDAMLII